MKMILHILIVLLCLTSCTARRMPSSTATLSPEVANGRNKYMQYCQKCHPMGESGLAPAMNNNPAPGFVKRFQVRHGLGAMPAFKKDVISRQDLRDIMRYMKSMKKEAKLPT